MIDLESKLSECTLCPRACKVNRIQGIRGFCGCDARLLAARAALHMWEEPCISGENGSGAVFFSGCQLRCIFCQNSKIADGTIAKEISVRRLSEIFLELQNKGAYNINLVTPTHYAGHIINALYLAKAAGLSIPVVYNSSGYEKVETLKLLDGLVDVYLPDMKYLDEKIALKYSKAADYPKIAMQAIEEMFRQTGNPVFDEKNGIMKKGMIVRHLVLPGNTEDSKKVIKYLYEKYGNNIYLSIMSQYTPMKAFLEDEKYKAIYPELGRKLSGREYDEVVDYAIELGVENAFIQEGDTADESFIPEFDYLGL